MHRTSHRRALTPGLAALGVIGLLAACTPPNERIDPDATSNLEGTLNGAGSSAQEAAQGTWQAGFQTLNPGVTVNYDPVGSGGGREQFLAGGVAFAGSDAYLSEDEGELSAAEKQCGSPAIEVPSYVSPIAVIYNIEGVDRLRLSPEVLAGIFNGKITSWDDPRIVEDNPDTDLPASRITPVHRADDSGTTENFTEYLSQAGGGAWPHDPDGVWPIKAGEAGQGTSGVVSAVKNGQGTIGYADESQAGDLAVAEVRVGDEYVEPTPEAAARILEVSERVEGRAEVDMAYELDRATQESGVYPIVLTSYLIACQTYPDEETAELVKGYLSYVVGEEGQQAAAESAGSAPLSPSIQETALDIIEEISVRR
ncbi:MAG TPA: phosphate ABC transporter substrate-binding protein PstS [Nocardioidaceae bacterium]|nr:phosphate ABC transporter substrate-binding protein PstS [Nocardioidaceae bacterium]